MPALPHMSSTSPTCCWLQHCTYYQAMETESSGDSSLRRDAMMADNIQWISEQEQALGHGMVFVSAHDGHVAKTSYESMGNLLSRDFGEGYYVIGTDFYHTTCNMPFMNSRFDFGFYSHDPLAKAAKTAGLDVCWLDFSKIPADSELGKACSSYMYMGSLGEGYSPLMLVLPMMSCSARLPIYIMITGAFFAVRYQSLVMISLYLVGIALSVVVSRILSTWVIRGEDTPFVMELPPYRFPTAKAIFRHTWEKGKQYLKKMGGVILVASIIVWALGYFGPMGVAPSLESSFIGLLGKMVEPLFLAQGFDWRMDVSLIAGVGAKEIVASTIGVLYGDAGFNFSSLTAYAFLLFVLIYFPCIATIVAIKNESASWRWAAFAALYTTVLAWIVSALVYQIGSLF